MDLEQFIFPIYSGGTIIGQCFIADGYLITAAHVIKDFPSCYTRIKGKRFEFSKIYLTEEPIIPSEPFFTGKGDYNHDSTSLDIVIFRCYDIHSSLHLSTSVLHKGEKLNNYCSHEVMDFSQLNPPCEIRMVPAIVRGEEEGNYFYCDCKQFGGSSGSPLLKGNEVVGIMHGGDGNGLCAFLKTDVVSEIISRKELSMEYNECDFEHAWEDEGCTYSKDKKRLLKGTDNTILHGTIVICNEAFCRYDYRGNSYGMASGDLIIPSSVKKIGKRAFAWSQDLETVVIPDSVIQIGKELFYCCTFLKSIAISKSLTEITNGMFTGCQNLQDITIPSSVTKIGEDAFNGCESLSNIVVPSNVTHIGDLAFYDCTSLTQVIFLGIVEDIDGNIFEGCTSLSQIVIPCGSTDKYKEMLPDLTDLLVEDEYIGKVANPLEWSPVSDKFTLEEIWDATGMSYKDIDGNEAEVTAVEFSDGSTSLRISVSLKDGRVIELKGGKVIQNCYNEGDKVKVDLIYGYELHKVGGSTIVRYDVWESVEEKNKYLEERDSL